MKFLKQTRSSRVGLYSQVALAILAAGSVAQTQAQVTNLTSPNGSSFIQGTFSGPTSGINSWQLLGGPSQLTQQWFYYSLDVGPSVGLLNPIDQISTPTITGQTGALGFLQSVYANSALSVTANFKLGNASGVNPTSTLTDTLTILNPSTSGQTETVHFYQYTDIDLGGASGGQTVKVSNNGSFVNYLVNQTGSPIANYTGKISGASLPTDKVQTGLSTQFGLGVNTVAPTLDNTTLTSGPGDAVYAYEWDATLSPGQSFQLSELQSITVPEPSTIALLSLGTLGFAFLHRRRQIG